MKTCMTCFDHWLYKQMTLKVENEASIIAYLSVITIMNYVILCCSYVYAHAHAGV